MICVNSFPDEPWSDKYSSLERSCDFAVQCNAMQCKTIDVSGGFQGVRLACALLKQEATARSQVPKIAVRVRVLSTKNLFELDSIAEEMFEGKWKGPVSRAHS